MENMVTENMGKPSAKQQIDLSLFGGEFTMVWLS